MKKLLKVLKWFGIIILSIISLIGIVLFVQYLFSYDEKDFDIPESFFDRMYEDKPILSSENGVTEFFIALRYSPDFILNGTETEEEYMKMEMTNITKFSGKLYEYYENKYHCEVEKNEMGCDNLNKYINNLKFDIEELEYNGEKFKDSLIFIEKKLSLYEDLKDKEYIKYEYYDFFPSLQGWSGEARSIGGVIIMLFENGNYNKGTELITKYIESIDDITNKIFINDVILSIVLHTISNINHSTIEYIISNYQDIPKEQLIILLTQLEKPKRELNYEEMIKAEFWQWNYIFENYISLNNELLTKKYKNSMVSRHGLKLLDLLYSEKESKALLKKLVYDFISKKGNKSDLEISSKFLYSNLNNFFGRFMITILKKDSTLSYGYNYDYDNDFEQNRKKRQELIEKLEELINSKQDNNSIKNAILQRYK